MDRDKERALAAVRDVIERRAYSNHPVTAVLQFAIEVVTRDDAPRVERATLDKLYDSIAEDIAMSLRDPIVVNRRSFRIHYEPAFDGSLMFWTTDGHHDQVKTAVMEAFVKNLNREWADALRCDDAEFLDVQGPWDRIRAHFLLSKPLVHLDMDTACIVEHVPFARYGIS